MYFFGFTVLVVMKMRAISFLTKNETRNLKLEISIMTKYNPFLHVLVEIKHSFPQNFVKRVPPILARIVEKLATC